MCSLTVRTELSWLKMSGMLLNFEGCLNRLVVSGARSRVMVSVRAIISLIEI